MCRAPRRPGKPPKCQWVPLSWTGADLVMGRGLGHVRAKGRPDSARRAGERRRAELGEFLKARRARLSPGDFGMPQGSRRRTPGLRREEVALLAGVGVTWYTWLEQGRQINASTQVLDAVARTLRLDRVEREHLYRLAEATPLRTECSRQAVPDTIREIVDSLDPLPASLINSRFDILCVERRLRGAVLGVAHAAVRPQEHPVVLRHRAERPGQVPRVRRSRSATWSRGCAPRTAGISATRTGKKTSAGWPA